MTETKTQNRKKPRKNQDVLDFIEWVKKRLGDENPKNFGLYMKLYKQAGKNGLLKGVTATLKKKDLIDKLPYFLGVVYRELKEKQQEKAKRVKVVIEEEQAKANRKKYEKLLSKLKKKLTPKYQRTSRTRSRMMHAVSKQERQRR